MMNLRMTELVFLVLCFVSILFSLDPSPERGYHGVSGVRAFVHLCIFGVSWSISYGMDGACDLGHVLLI